MRKRTEGESAISSSPELTCEGGRFYFNQAELVVDRQSKTVFCKLNLVMLFHGELTRQLSSSEFVYRENLNSEGVLLYLTLQVFISNIVGNIAALNSTKRCGMKMCVFVYVLPL